MLESIAKQAKNSYHAMQAIPPSFLFEHPSQISDPYTQIKKVPPGPTPTIVEMTIVETC